MTSDQGIGRGKEAKAPASGARRTVLLPAGEPVARGLAERLVGYSFAEAVEAAGQDAKAKQIPLAGIVDGEMVTTRPDGSLGRDPRRKRQSG